MPAVLLQGAASLSSPCGGPVVSVAERRQCGFGCAEATVQFLHGLGESTARSDLSFRAGPRGVPFSPGTEPAGPRCRTDAARLPGGSLGSQCTPHGVARRAACREPRRRWRRRDRRRACRRRPPCAARATGDAHLRASGAVLGARTGRRRRRGSNLCPDPTPRMNAALRRGAPALETGGRWDLEAGTGVAGIPLIPPPAPERS
jgi:hypothetical protein